VNIIDVYILNNNRLNCVLVFNNYEKIVVHSIQGCWTGNKGQWNARQASPADSLHSWLIFALRINVLEQKFEQEKIRI
jgi:hypothetical protein